VNNIVKMFFPKNLSNKRFTPFFKWFPKEFFAHYKRSQKKYANY